MPRSRIFDCFENKQYINVSAPMVRYSKLPFRQLVREYNVDVCYTPMILAKEFINSQKARQVEFTTSETDTPTVIQFASNDPTELLKAAQLVEPFVDAIDLNCGCPQTWAIQDRIGSYLLRHPQLISEIIKTVKLNTSLACSIKIRIDTDINKTIQLCQNAQHCKVDFIVVHGRYVDQRSSSPPHYHDIKLIQEVLDVPVIANGDCFSLEDADAIIKATNTKGVMAARGLLENPALFSGYKTTPKECVQKYIQIALEQKTNFHIFHNHLISMLDKSMCNAEKKYFNTLTSIPAILDYLEPYFNG